METCKTFEMAANWELAIEPGAEAGGQTYRHGSRGSRRDMIFDHKPDFIGWFERINLDDGKYKEHLQGQQVPSIKLSRIE